MELMTTTLTKGTPAIAGLREIAADYDAILCDVWGVIHNGVSPYDDAATALSEFRKQGKQLVSDLVNEQGVGVLREIPKRWSEFDVED